MPVISDVSQTVTEQISVSKIVTINPIWEITDVNISNKGKTITIMAERGYTNSENVFVVISRDRFVIMDNDFIVLAMTVINGQTFYTAMKTLLYDYLITKGYISGTVS